MQPHELIGLMAVIFAFITPLAITGMVLKYRLNRRLAKGASNAEVEALRRDIADLRVDMQSRPADLTLMLNDTVSHLVPGETRRRLEDPDDKKGS